MVVVVVVVVFFVVPVVFFMFVLEGSYRLFQMHFGSRPSICLILGIMQSGKKFIAFSAAAFMFSLVAWSHPFHSSFPFPNRFHSFSFSISSVDRAILHL